MKIILEGNPQSTNHIYKSFRSRIYLSAEGRALKTSYQYQAKKQMKFKKPLDGPLSVKIKLFFGDKKKRDIDNYNKILLDSLSHIVYLDDSQIQIMCIAKLYDKQKPRIEIEAEEINDKI